MTKGNPPPRQAEHKKTANVDKENAAPRQAEDRKSVNMATSPEEPSESPEKVADTEKSDDEYPQGLTLYFIMLGLCLVVFLIAIGKLAFLSIAGMNF